MTPRTPLALLLATGCASGGAARLTDEVRFKNDPIVWAVNDRQHTPKPEKRLVLNLYYPYVSYFGERIPRFLDVPGQIRAQNTNALDEVPDSTWFTNRIGRFDLSPTQVGMGPNRDGPDMTQPWKIRGTKVGGTSVGFIMTDGRGVKYLLKFDQKGIPEMETAADVVAQRLLWAVGYHVPEDSIVFFDRSQLRLTDDAEIKDRFGHTSTLGLERFERILGSIDRRPDGTFRGLASKFLPGRPLGGYSPRGTRDDDPNDVVPHQHRRDLRGQYVVFSWLSHTDLKEGNWLDMWVRHPADPERRYIKHFLIDFGKSLGVMAVTDNILHEGYLYSIDVANFFLSAPTLGLWQRPWERLVIPNLPGIGAFDSATFEPSAWKPRVPFEPFDRRNRFDDFWAAKIVMRLSAAHIAAAVAAGRYSNQESARYLTRILVERQRKIGRWALARVNPLDRFRIEHSGGPRLCYDDLWRTYRLGHEEAGSQTAYDIAVFGYDGVPLMDGVAVRARGRSACTPPLPSPPGRTDGYRIVSIRTRRAAHPDLEPTLVHLANHPTTHALRIIGLRRL